MSDSEDSIDEELMTPTEDCENLSAEAGGAKVKGEEPRKRKATQFEHQTPRYFIYFAKYEEFNLLDPAKHKLEFKRRTLVNKLTCDVYVYEKELLVGVLHGPGQGIGFYFDFVRFVKEFEPLGVIMCGLCAGDKQDSDLKPGTVIVSTAAILLQGKLSAPAVESLMLDGVAPRQVSDHCKGLEGRFKAPTDNEFKVVSGAYLQAPFVMDTSLDSLFNKVKPANRRAKALEMESWFCLDAQWRLKCDNILPVVKGISDFGAGKEDTFHPIAVNNSTRVAMFMLQQLSRKLLTQPLPKRSGSIVKEKKPKKEQQALRLPWTTVKSLLVDAPHDTTKDLEFLGKMLVTKRAPLGITALRCYQNALSALTVTLLDKEINHGKTTL